MYVLPSKHMFLVGLPACPNLPPALRCYLLERNFPPSVFAELWNADRMELVSETLTVAEYVIKCLYKDVEEKQNLEDYFTQM